MRAVRRICWGVVGSTWMLLAGCGDPGGDPSPTPESSPTPQVSTPGVSPTPAATSTPEPSPGATLTPEPTPGATSTPEPTPAMTPTLEPTPGATSTPEPTAEPTPAATPTLEPTPAVTPTLEPTPPEDVDGDGFTPDGGDCDDEDRTAHPGATEVAYDGVDQDCDGVDLTDVDRDGFDASVVDGGDDCDDNDLNTYPGAVEFADGKDNDCDHKIDEDLDSTDDDGDGYSELEGDCNDYDKKVHPDAAEVPYDGIDQDCDSADLTDVDGDGYDSSKVNGGNDCNDQDASIHPNASEVPYDGKDQDCLGGDLVDVDADGYASSAVGGPDCNDKNAAVNPGALEVCEADGATPIDNNCDGVIDTDAANRKTWYADADHDGYGSSSQSVQACSAPAGYLADPGSADRFDCDDSRSSVHPGATETCNGLDDDCDTQVDEGVTSTYYQDQDADGYGAAGSSTQACSTPSGYVVDPGAPDRFDCNDASISTYPGAPESCNGLDESCDGVVDEGVKSTFYQDQDLDGYGVNGVTTQACSAPSGYAGTADDCNDGAASIHPNAVESCNGIDDDCDSSVDEGSKTTWYRDADLDGYGNPAVTTEACTVPGGYVANNTDCDDSSAAINPSKSESANGKDDNCNGQIDEGIVVSSCKSIKTSVPSSPDGLYTIDPDGTGPDAAFQVYCDMTTDGGGWTVMKQYGSGKYYANTLFISQYNAMGRSLTFQGKVGDNTYAQKYVDGLYLNSTQVMISWKFETTKYVEYPTGYVIWNATPAKFNPALETETNCANTGFWTQNNHACDYGGGETNVAKKTTPRTIGLYAFMDLGATQYTYGSWADYSVWTANNDGNILAQSYDDGRVMLSFR